MSIFSSISNQPPAVSNMDKEGAWETQKSHMFFPRDAEPALYEILPNPEYVNRLLNIGFWAFKIRELSENHGQAYALNNVLSDSFLAFASGSKPIQIGLTGWVKNGTTKDHQLDMLYMFMNCFRGSVAENKLRIPVILQVRETIMRVFLDALMVSKNSQRQDITDISLTGVASNYHVAQINISKDTTRTESIPRAEVTYTSGRESYA